MTKARPRSALLFAAIALVGCSTDLGGSSEESRGGSGGARPIVGTVFGEPVDGLDAEDEVAFDEGLDAFAEVETIEDGLGPVFNEASCGTCHVLGAVGGAGTRTVTRFGRTRNGVFDPLAASGGSLAQDHGIGMVDTCNYVPETPPATANVVAHRVTTPLFGLGLVDAVPDSTFERLAQQQRERSSRTAGRTNRVLNVVTGQTVVGKFGWKSQVPSLFQFSGDAYLNEMGITSPMFPEENCPSGNCALLACDPVPDPEDDGDDLDLFTNFMSLLGPPPQLPRNRTASHGQNVFSNVGCTNCHTASLTTEQSDVPALNQRMFFPYSDFLLHDMGALGDGIGGQGRATPTEMRTAPLWGIRVRTNLLHDGRATSIEQAILAHDGQARDARERFRRLDRGDRAALVAFLNTL